MSIAPIGIALIGAGRIGQLHARNIIRNARTRLLCVLEQDKERARSIAEASGCREVPEFEDAVSFPGVEAIWICSPTDTHIDYVLRSVDAGKYVFCEKPVDLDLERAKACVQQLGQRATRVMMGFNRRFDPSLAAICQSVRRGDVGDVEQILVISRDPAPPSRLYVSQSGGIFRDMTIHDFDTVRSFVPFEFSKIFAHGASLFSDDIRALNDYDTVSVQLFGPKGETCTILNSRRCSYGFEQRIEIFGSTGTIALENPRPISATWFTQEGERRGPLYEFFPQRYASSYEHLLDDFVSKARSDEPFSVTIHDGLCSLALAEAARRSVENLLPISMSAIS